MNGWIHHSEDQTTPNESLPTPVMFHNPVKQHHGHEPQYSIELPPWYFDEGQSNCYAASYFDAINQDTFCQRSYASVTNSIATISDVTAKHFDSRNAATWAWNPPQPYGRDLSFASAFGPQDYPSADLTVSQVYAKSAMYSKQQRNIHAAPLSSSVRNGSSITVAPNALLLTSPFSLPPSFSFGSDPLLSTSSRGSNISSITSPFNDCNHHDIHAVSPEQHESSVPYDEIDIERSKIFNHAPQDQYPAFEQSHARLEQQGSPMTNLPSSKQGILLQEQVQNVLHAPRPRHILPNCPTNLETKASKAHQPKKKSKDKRSTKKRTLQSRKASLVRHDEHSEEFRSMQIDQIDHRTTSNISENGFNIAQRALHFSQEGSTDQLTPESHKMIEQQSVSSPNQESSDSNRDSSTPYEPSIASRSTSPSTVNGPYGTHSIKAIIPPTWSTSASERRNQQDSFLVVAKQSGMSYRDIRLQGRFSEAESTLRGRFRTLTKTKSARVRKPQWKEKDVSCFLR